MQKWGWSPSQAAAIAGNMVGESSMDPFAWDKARTTYGIGQWDNDRRKKYTKLYGHQMDSVKDRSQALREQLAFYNWELTSNDKLNDPRNKRAGDHLKRTANEYGGVQVLVTEFERSKNQASDIVKRDRYAHDIKVRISNQTGASVATTANTASK
jgi:hypothetical protein